MPSFDYIYDLIDKFKTENFGFVLSFLQQGKESDQVHVFYEYNNKEEAREMIEALELAIENIKGEIGDDGEMDMGEDNGEGGFRID